MSASNYCTSIPAIRGMSTDWKFGEVIDKTPFTVEVQSEHGKYAAENMVNRDPWYGWSSDAYGSFPHTVIIDMGDSHWVDGMTYYPPGFGMPSGSSIAGYEVWVGNNYVPEHCDDNDNLIPANGAWGRVASGTFSYDRAGQRQKIDFLVPNKARFIKFVAISNVSGNNIAAIGEITLTESIRTDEHVITGGGI